MKLESKIRKAIGAGPDDEIRIVTPQFHRAKTEPAPASPPEDFDILKELPIFALRELGLRPWGREELPDGTEVGPMLWLYPGEWYDAIPNGYPVVDINFQKETFVRGATDNDIRFGCLAFGLLRE